MSKYKALKKDEVEIIANKLYDALGRLKSAVSEKDAYISMGYAEGTIEKIIRQMKGEYPI